MHHQTIGFHRLSNQRIAGEKFDNPADVVRLNYYVTDIAAFHTAAPKVGVRLRAADCKPASTLLGVAGLAMPELMIELEATAAG